MAVDRCLCMSCVEVGKFGKRPDPFFDRSGDWATFRYACEVCNNKRCPHHSDHRLACTNSNEPGQPGSNFR